MARRRGPECGTTTPLPAALPSRYRRLDPHRVLRGIEIAAHRAGFVGNNAINTQVEQSFRFRGGINRPGVHRQPLRVGELHKPRGENGNRVAERAAASRIPALEQAARAA